MRFHPIVRSALMLLFVEGTLSLCSAQEIVGDWRYAVFELEPLGGDYSYGVAIDESGNCARASYLQGNRVFHATLWIDGQQSVDLGTLGGEDSECRAINENGWIVGRSTTRDGGPLDFGAFLWRDGEMINLGYLQEGDFSEAYGINDRNQIVGRSNIGPNSGITRAFLWENGQMTELARGVDNPDTEAIAINNAGLICGLAWGSSFYNWRPVIWENGGLVDLGTFREDNRGGGVAIDVNESGDVVGYADWDHSAIRAFVYRNGQKYALPERDRWVESAAWSINDNRQIVGGTATREHYESIGCIWEWGQEPQNLLTLIPPKSNWFIGLAIGNNNAGQITGTGYRLDNPDFTRGYLLTPVHPSMELSAPVPGAAGEENTRSVTGAEPGARVTLVYSRSGGGTAIPGCRLQENCLQLDEPKVIGTAIADANGEASITRFVPDSARGQKVLLQALVGDACAVSQLVVLRFE